MATGKALLKMYGEDVLPTREQRRATYGKYVEKFQKIRDFFGGLELLIKRGSASEALTFLLDGMRILGRYTALSDRRALEILAAQFREADGRNTEDFLREFVGEAELSYAKTDRFFSQRKAVPLMTVHQAKGCEFDLVILAGADDCNFPNLFATAENSEEEEKKIFYVAITRAKKKLILTRAEYHGGGELLPSRYVRFLPEEFVFKNERWEIND